MSNSETSDAAKEIYRALAGLALNDNVGKSMESLVEVVFRLMTELEAIREALSSPDIPEQVRQSYRLAYERIAVLSHNAGGISGGTERILGRFFPSTSESDRFHCEMVMMVRLGATGDELRTLREQLDEVESYT
jgi:hypothetical protein